MVISDDILKSLKTHLNCPDLQFFFRPEWGSTYPEHRELIRNDLKYLFEEKGINTSISHCPQLGVVAASRQPIGVDVEVVSRVQKNVAARISTPEELSAAPDFAALWCAKEACFKALKTYQQPSVISKVSIGDWQKIDSHFDIFQCVNAGDFNSPANHKGIILKLQDLCFCFFVFFT